MKSHLVNTEINIAPPYGFKYFSRYISYFVYVRILHTWYYILYMTALIRTLPVSGREHTRIAIRATPLYSSLITFLKHKYRLSFNFLPEFSAQIRNYEESFCMEASSLYLTTAIFLNVPFTVHFTAMSVSRLYGIEWYDWWIGKDLEGSSCGVTKLLSWHLSGGA
jgi:hypothetical protein